MVVMVKAVLFDFSGTLFRLEEDESWFEGMTVDEREVDGHVQAELMRRLTAPTGRSVQMSDEQYHAWVNRDLAPHLHREAYLHVLRESGLADPHAESLYGRVIDPDSWTAYPDTATVLKSLKQQDIKTAVVSNIAFDVRPAFTALGIDADVDEFVLSYEVGAVKPDARSSRRRCNGWVSHRRTRSWSATARRPTAVRPRWDVHSRWWIRCRPPSGPTV